MKHLVLCVLAVLATAAVAADQNAEGNAAGGDPRAVIAKKFPGVKPEDVRTSPIEGIYEVTLGADIAYVSADGRYIIAGDMYEIDTRKNVTETKRTTERVKALAKLDERDMIVFKPTTVKHTVTVFTDVNCAYCRKLHSEIDKFTALGIKVRYVAYPREGPGSDDWHTMEAVWCSKDRKAAITQAKLGQEVKAEKCATPVAKQYQLGEDMGVRGTPAIFTTSGDYIGGYLSPTKMVEELDKLAADTKK
jgi:thiol:disulfide interchange protein DsbC